MPARWKTTDLPENSTQAARSSAKRGNVPPKPSEGRTIEISMPTDPKQPAQLRPRYHVPTFPGFEGQRFSAYGLTPVQVQQLVRAAEALGILKQN